MPLNPRLAAFDPTIVGSCRRFPAVVAAAVLVGAVAGTLGAWAMGSSTSAQAGIIIAPLPASISPFTSGHGEQAAIYVNQQVALLGSHRVALHAVKQLDRGGHHDLTAQQLDDALTVTPGVVSTVQTRGRTTGATTLVTVSLPNGTLSQQAANAVVHAYVALLRTLISQDTTSAAAAMTSSINRANAQLAALSATPTTTTTTTHPPGTTTTHPGGTTTTVAHAHRRHHKHRRGHATTTTTTGGGAHATSTTHPAATTSTSGPGLGVGNAALGRPGATPAAHLVALVAASASSASAASSTTTTTTPTTRTNVATKRKNLEQQISKATLSRAQLLVNEQIDLSYRPTVFAATASTTHTTGPRWARDVVVGAVAGLVVGIVVAYLLALRRRRFEDELDPERLYGVPELARVPAFTPAFASGIRLPVVADPDGPDASAIRRVATTLRLLKEPEQGLVVALTAAAPASGTSTLAANVGLALCEMGERVLVVDADPFEPGVSRILAVDGEAGGRSGPGLSEVLGGRPLHDTMRPSGPDDHLMVLTPGADDRLAQRRWRAADLRRVLVEAAGAFDLVLVDTPPLAPSSFTMDAVAAGRNTVLVVPHHDPVAPHVDVPERLAAAGAHLMGYVYNGAPRASDAPWARSRP